MLVAGAATATAAPPAKAAPPAADDIADADARRGHLLDSAHVDQALRSVDGDMADGDVAEDRRAPGHGLFRGRAFAAHGVVAGDHNSCPDVFHRPVVEPDVFDHAAPSAPALDAHAHLGAITGDVIGHQVTDPTRNFTAQRDCAMRVVNGAIGDGHVFGRLVDPPPIGVLAGFDHDAIVSGIDGTARNPHVPAGIRDRRRAPSR